MEAGKYALAVEMLMQAISYAPDALETRRLLRAAQIAKFREDAPSSFALKMQGIKNSFARQKILGLIKKGKPIDALDEAGV